MFIIRVGDTGPGIPNLDEILNGRYVSKTGLGMGLIGTRRLMEHFPITSTPSGTVVECGKPLPDRSASLTAANAKVDREQIANSAVSRSI